MGRRTSTRRAYFLRSGDIVGARFIVLAGSSLPALPTSQPTANIENNPVKAGWPSRPVNIRGPAREETAN